MPLGAVWSATEGTQAFDPAIFGTPHTDQADASCS